MKYITLQRKMPNLVAFLLSIAFVVMVGCDGPNKPNNRGGGTTPTSLAAPVITTHPTSQSISEGSTASLSVKATHPSGAKLSYQWQKEAKDSKDFTDIANATSESYTTPTLTLADNDMQYRVIVTATNSLKETASTTSNIVKVTVSPATPPAKPVITTHPISDTIAEGNTADLSVEATPPTGAKLSYQWQKAASGSTNFGDIAGATNDNYKTPTLTIADNGIQYRVVVIATNAAGIKSDTISDIATISVAVLPAKPVITKHPVSDTIAEGSPATLSVTATAPAGATLSYQWQKAVKGATDFGDVAGATNDNITTPTLVYADSGVQYRVVVTATNANGLTNSTTSDIATLSVIATQLGTPSITTHPISDTIAEGNTATLNVVATPPTGATLSYQWQKAAKGSSTFTDVAGATNNNYTTPTLNFADNGTQYRVIVIATHTANGISTSTSNTATITITILPPTAPVITTKPMSQIINEGRTATLNVVVTAVTGATLSYQWQTATKDATDFEDIAGATSDSYITPTLTVADGGVRYRVVVTATNATGLTNSTTSEIATISVVVSPTVPVITTQPVSDTITEGTTATLNVVTTAVTGALLSYQWQKAVKGTTDFGDIAGATKEEYTTPTLVYADSGVQYRVVVTATNPAGVTKSTISEIATISVFVSARIVWTDINGTRHEADVPTDGVLLSSTLTATATNIKSVDVIPSGVTSIGERAFAGCSGLTSITIPSGVTGIGNYAFNKCTSLMRISIPNTVTSIGEYVFDGCTALTNITIPEGITNIENGAFYGCSGLTSITIPSSVTSIGNYAFNGCVNLARITIPSNVNTIGNSVFNRCERLTSITIPSSVNTIGNSAFSNCSSLTNVRMESTTPPTAGKDMFKDTHASLIIRVPDAKVGDYRAATNWITYKPIIYGFNEAIVPKIQWTHINGTKQYTDAPADGILLGRTLTATKTDIKSVDFIPDNITSIGASAFYSYTALTSITIPSSVTSIGNNAFNGCDKLTNITIPNSVTSIGNKTFISCSGLTSITLPERVASVGDSTFLNCSSLVSITLPKYAKNMGKSAFAGCSVLESITIPYSMTSIGGYAFYNCSGLTSVTMGNNVASIGEWAFSGCSSLTSITIPYLVKNIGDYAFEGCKSLRSVRVEAQDPPNAAGNIFNGTPSNLSITVPNGRALVYKTAGWNTYADRITEYY